MVSLNAMGMENRGGCSLEAVLLVEAQEREELSELSIARNSPNFWGKPGTSTIFAPSRKQKKPLSKFDPFTISNKMVCNWPERFSEP